MSQFEEKVSEMLSEATKLGWTVNEDLLTKIAKGLGPSIYNTDSSLVSSSDQAELDRVKQNFLIGKLGCAEDESLDQAIDEVVNAFGSSNRNKHRNSVLLPIGGETGKRVRVQLKSQCTKF
jgi:hypothetical protein